MCNHKHNEYLVTTDTLWVICVVCAIPSVYTCIIRIIEIGIWYTISYDIEKCIGQDYFSSQLVHDVSLHVLRPRVYIFVSDGEVLTVNSTCITLESEAVVVFIPKTSNIPIVKLAPLGRPELEDDTL